jgi:hypothetical protein
MEAAAAPSDFDRFWAAFPPGRKHAKAEARDLFNRIASGRHKTRRATADEIIAAAERYAATKPDPKYTPAPTTWLNGGRWEDDDGGNANVARQPQLDDMSGNLERSRIFLAKVGVGPDKPWPTGIGPQSFYHPAALFELGIPATEGSS